MWRELSNFSRGSEVVVLASAPSNEWITFGIMPSLNVMAGT
jgi:hypothetical protein